MAWTCFVVVACLLVGTTLGYIEVDCKKGCPDGQCFNYRCPFTPCKRKTDVCHDRQARLKGAFCRPEYCGGCFARWFIWMYPEADREIDVTHRCTRRTSHSSRRYYSMESAYSTGDSYSIGNPYTSDDSFSGIPSFGPAYHQPHSHVPQYWQ